MGQGRVVWLHHRRPGAPRAQRTQWLGLHCVIRQDSLLSPQVMSLQPLRSKSETVGHTRSYSCQSGMSPMGHQCNGTQ
jgi:hypothetical protein